MSESTLLVNNIIAFASLAAIAVMLVLIPVSIKKNGSESLKNRGSSFWAREVAIILSSIAIPLLCLFIHFEIVPTAALCGCSIMATWVGVQELKKKD